ncbi:2-(3-amino-3-carboxypropyl)histidine synthase [Candidatus Woesearchaeota archaeon]|nr:2-(3-amino-3-carboxypropyl)histidine synthase [Candidatus Woesearchaeota archaeon]
MKLSFIDVKYKHPVVLPKDFLDSLPEKVMLFLNIQFHPQYDAIKKQLETAGKKVLTERPKHAWHEGQILGCSVEEWDKGQDAFVYVGDGLFHPKALLFHNSQPVHIYDPKIKKSSILTKEEVAQILKSQKGAMATFYASTKIGILITTKYGQTRILEAMKLRKKYPEKTFYYLLSDVIDFNKLEDFPFIECFINTACPRIMDDNQKVPKPMVNISDLGQEW